MPKQEWSNPEDDPIMHKRMQTREQVGQTGCEGRGKVLAEDSACSQRHHTLSDHS
jgi:hypothetical protein